MHEAVLLQLRRPHGCRTSIGRYSQSPDDRLVVVDVLDQASDMGTQLRCGLAIFGNIVNTHQILGLTGIALGPHAIALFWSELVRLGAMTL